MHKHSLTYQHSEYVLVETADKRSEDVLLRLHPGASSLFFAGSPLAMSALPDWGLFLRRIVDTEKATVIVTGSSSRLLSKDIATEFRGRSLAFELLPFSFREYIRHLGLSVDGGVRHSQRGLISQHFK